MHLHGLQVKHNPALLYIPGAIKLNGCNGGFQREQLLLHVDHGFQHHITVQELQPHGDGEAVHGEQLPVQRCPHVELPSSYVPFDGRWELCRTPDDDLEQEVCSDPLPY
ncbi:hypothetical protein BRADI_4g02524v3 [Brachypodium distachyon]|uniref:Uncharacterized protein n=1 Tax=Brachypodium distachyon TaxID=15368 RepID=A0A2K2CK39_BRADI|nr:hypothetical protein BRADI_4g02524v3 [Brachypodium distachyon]